MTSAMPTQPGDHVWRWDRGWGRIVFPAFWLVYLGQTVSSVHRHSAGWAAVVGYAIVVVFAATYLTALTLGWTGRHRAFWWLFGVGVVLTVAETFFAHSDAFVFLVYLGVLIVAAQVRVALPTVLLFAVVITVVPTLVPSWHAGVDYAGGLSVLLVSLAMFGFFKIVHQNIALTAARSEIARLAAENERSRIARDLHDLLGHSLTTITVKAGLARRLAERGEGDRARVEIGEVEQLSRRTLGDVRAAVSMHRDVTLAGELATAREVLRAAGISAELPASVAETDPALSELFGWVVREGITNIVRHSRAQRVTIVVGVRTMEICDDGRGGSCTAGNGLCGLRERVEAAGGSLTVRGEADGFWLRVDVDPVRDAEPSARAIVRQAT